MTYLLNAQNIIRPDWRKYPIYSEARKTLLKNDYKTSIDLLEKAVVEAKDNPDHLVWVYEDLAGVLMLYGEPDKAFKYLQKMVEMGFGKTYYQLSVLTKSERYNYLRQLQRWDELLTKARNNFIEQAKSNGDSPEVQFLFQEDQADRLFLSNNLSNNNLLDTSQLIIRVREVNKKLRIEWLRQQEMKKLVKERKLKSVNDFRSAVFIFHHSGDIADIKLANDLAMQGYNLAKNENERCSMEQMITLTTDRMLWNQGKPQIYGTQFRPSSLSFEEFLEIGQKSNELVKKYIRHGKDVPFDLAIAPLKNLPPPTNNMTMTTEPIDLIKGAEKKKKLCNKSIDNK